jgi:hypothetical protein
MSLVGRHICQVADVMIEAYRGTTEGVLAKSLPSCWRIGARRAPHQWHASQPCDAPRLGGGVGFFGETVKFWAVA